MVSCARPFTTNLTISTSISQIFRSWLATFHLRQPMVFVYHNGYDMPGLAPRLNDSFWVLCDFHKSFSNSDMSGDVWNRLSGSFMINIWNLIKQYEVSPPKCYMTFWDMTTYSDILHYSHISLNRDLDTDLDLIADADFDLLPKLSKSGYK